jgi:hypothetical protein
MARTKNLPVSVDDLERQMRAVTKASGLPQMAPEPIYGAQNVLRVKNQRFYIGEAEVPQPVEVVIIGSAFRQNYYTEKYDPDTRTPPVCFAMNKDYNLLVPDPTSPKVQHGTASDPKPCATCRWNLMGSSTREGGSRFARECVARRRFAILLLDDKSDDPVIGSVEISASALAPFSRHIKAALARYGVEFFSMLVTKLNVEINKKTDTWYVGALDGGMASRAKAAWCVPARGVKIGAEGWWKTTIIGRKEVEVEESKVLLQAPTAIVDEAPKKRRPVTGAKRVTVRQARAARTARTAA